MITKTSSSFTTLRYYSAVVGSPLLSHYIAVFLSLSVLLLLLPPPLSLPLLSPSLSLDTRALSFLPRRRLGATAAASCLWLCLSLSLDSFTPQRQTGVKANKQTNRKGRKREKKVAATGRTTTMTRSWLKLNGLANLFWALMRLETWVAAAWYLSLSSSGNIFTVSSPPDVEMAFLILRMPRVPGDNNRHLNARSPVPLLWRADS